MAKGKLPPAFLKGKLGKAPDKAAPMKPGGKKPFPAFLKKGK